MRRDSAAPHTKPGSVLDHVLVGIDDTPTSLVAAVQANTLRPAGSRLVLVGVTERYLAAHAGLAARYASARVVESTSEDLARAEALAAADETVMAAGRLVPVLDAECARRGGTLVAIGSRPHRRLGALTFGGHDEEALATTTCSLLIARPGWGPRRPDRVVLAAGSSAEARHAGSVARGLADRIGVELLAVVGLEDEPSPELVAREHAEAILEPGSQIDALAHASDARSLVVVGDSQKRIAARVAHGVVSSVLVVRERVIDAPTEET